ncbi:MAG: hypothetical protein R3C10_00675 [Pirellulales bacterium]
MHLEVVGEPATPVAAGARRSHTPRTVKLIEPPTASNQHPCSKHDEQPSTPPGNGAMTWLHAAAVATLPYSPFFFFMHRSLCTSSSSAAVVRLRLK